MSGLRFTYDVNLAVGSRIKEVFVGERPLDPAATYKVATNNYLFAGNDGYTALTKGKSLMGGAEGRLVVDVVIDHVAALKTLAPKVESRIVAAAP